MLQGLKTIFSDPLALLFFLFFFFNDTPPTEIYPLPLPAALPILVREQRAHLPLRLDVALLAEEAEAVGIVQVLTGADGEQDVVLPIGTGKDLDDPNRFRFFGQESYVKSEREMRALFPDQDRKSGG